MEFQVPIKIETLPKPIAYQQKIMLVGSCFTEHIGDKLQELKFNVLQNPNGILFDPASVAYSLESYITPKEYTEKDLFYYNELWQSWQHHSCFSNTNKADCLRIINNSQQQAHSFLKDAEWLFITLGTSFSYRLADISPSTEGAQGKTEAVANCHRAPAQWFNKHMMSIEETTNALSHCLDEVQRYNSKLKVIFTVSPVRHIRDGVIENNRSKARLIEVVHHLVNKYENVFYFPAYEIVIDVLRDYRFFDIDMVHPNYQATQFVLEKFMQHCIEEDSRRLSEEIQLIMIARKHKPFQPATDAHRNFLRAQLQKAKDLKAKHPFLEFEEEIRYFQVQAS